MNSLFSSCEIIMSRPSCHSGQLIAVELHDLRRSGSSSGNRGDSLQKATVSQQFRKHRKKVHKAVRPSVNPLKKLQLSIFNSSLIPINPDPNRMYRILTKKPISLKAFCKHMILIRKYEVLLKIEFQVRGLMFSSAAQAKLFRLQAASRNETYTKHVTRHASKPNNELKNTYPNKVPCKCHRESSLSFSTFLVFLHQTISIGLSCPGIHRTRKIVTM